MFVYLIGQATISIFIFPLSSQVNDDLGIIILQPYGLFPNVRRAFQRGIYLETLLFSFAKKRQLIDSKALLLNH